MAKQESKQDNKYLIANALKRSSEIPLLYKKSINKIYKASQGSIPEKLERHEELVVDFLTQITVDRLSSLHKSNVFDFHFTGTKVSYNFQEIKEALEDNVDFAPNKTLERASDLISTIVTFAVSPVTNIFDFHPDVQPRIDNKTLIKFIEILEDQTYDNLL